MEAGSRLPGPQQLADRPPRQTGKRNTEPGETPGQEIVHALPCSPEGPDRVLEVCKWHWASLGLPNQRCYFGRELQSSCPGPPLHRVKEPEITPAVHCERTLLIAQNAEASLL